MPSAAPVRAMMASNTLRKPKGFSQQRQASTVQDSLRPGDDGEAFALLHGQRGSASHPQHPTVHESSSKQLLDLQSKTSQTRRGQQPKDPLYDTSKPSSNGEQRHVGQGRKRGRDSEVLKDPRPSTRRRAGPASGESLKDVAYIRRSMRVPTQEDYPELKPALFQNPKGHLRVALRNPGVLRSEYTSISPGLFRFTLSCTLSPSEPTEEVLGEGVGKVRISSKQGREVIDAS